MVKMLNFLILAFTIISVLLCWLYLYANDYGTEAMQALHPLGAACAVALCVQAKLILIDAPSKTTLARGTSVILERTNGELTGVQWRDTYGSGIYRTGIGKVGVSAAVSPHYLDQSFDRAKLVMDALQYAFVDWIRDLHSIQESWLNEEYVSVIPGVLAEFAAPKVERTMTSSSIADGKAFPMNGLFSISPIELSGPSSIRVSGATEAYQRHVVIDSKYSRIEVKFQLIGGSPPSVFLSGMTGDERINRSVVDGVKYRQVYAIGFVVTQEIKPLRRFSKEGRMHSQWGEMIGRKAIASFAYPEPIR